MSIAHVADEKTSRADLVECKALHPYIAQLDPVDFEPEVGVVSYEPVCGMYCRIHFADDSRILTKINVYHLLYLH